VGCRRSVPTTSPTSRRRSTREDGILHLEGDLTIVGTTNPIAFDLLVGDDGSVRGRAVVKQSDWGMKQYSILFGALKVADEVEVAIDARQSR